MTRKSLVVLESPYKGNGRGETHRNVVYARKCMRDCFMRGEIPFASHLLYTQPHILNDNDPDERMLGIEGGFVWGQHADKIVVYTDLGISEGMRVGVEKYKSQGKTIEFRKLNSRRENKSERRL